MAATAHQIGLEIAAATEQSVTNIVRKQTVFVYIKTALENERCADVAELLAHLPGIHDAHFALRNPNIMMVQFAPERIPCHDILETLKTTGLTVKIVGC